MDEVTRAAAAEAEAERRIDGRQVRLILGARWRILASQMSSSKWKLFFTLFALLLFAVFLLALTAGAGFGGYFLARSERWSGLARPAVHVLSHFIFLSLVASPILGLRGNEFLDVTKLFTLPVNHRTVFTATVLGLMTSLSVLFLALPCLAFVAGASGSIAEAVAAVLAAAFVVTAGVATGQAVYFLFLGTFSTRKWRDRARYTAAILGAGLYMGMQSFRSNALLRGLAPALEWFDGWKDFLLPLPSWWGAHAVTGTGVLRWLPALLLPVLIVWSIRVAARLQEAAFFSELDERTPAADTADTGDRRGFAAWLGARFPGRLGALVEKDATLFLRDPSVRIQMIQQFAFAAVPLGFVFLQGHLNVSSASIAVTYVPILSAFGIVMNLLGTEGSGLQQVLLTPVPRRTIVLSKLVTLWVVVGGVLAAIVVLILLAIGLYAQQDDPGVTVLRALAGGLETFAALGVFAGIGAVTGTLFPMPLAVRDRRALRQASSGKSGCLRTVLYFGSLFGGVAACAPVFLAFHMTMFAPSLAPFLAATIPMAVGFSVLIAWLGTVAGGGILADREETAVALLAKPPE